MNTIISIYTESTPNPETMKFVANKMILAHKSADFQNEESARNSPLATELFGFPFVKGVFFANNFVTITKHPQYDWHDIVPSMKEFIKDYLVANKPVITGELEKPAAEAESEPTTAEEAEIVAKLKQLLDTYVKPAVEMDGGNIQFRSYKDGIVKVTLQGACSGCPSSTVTLKAGIEGMLKRMVPEVKEVVAEAE